MIRNRRIAALVAALAIVAAMAGGIVYAAGPGEFGITLLGDGAQSGQTTITGACQAGETVTVEFQNTYDAEKWVVSSLSLSGIQAACTGGTLIVNNDDANGVYTFTVAAGAATVTLADPVFAVGDIDSLDILLTE